MPAPTSEELGPLAALVGTWEGQNGLDIAFHNATGKVIETPFRERTSFSPFGPVDNGDQSLFGLDYRTAAWRGDEEDPFHTEVGYWLWDAVDNQVMRCFMVPRGSTLLAGGPAHVDSRSFTMEATLGSPVYGILSNPYLDRVAQTTHFEVTVSIGDDGSFSYDETTTVTLARYGGPLRHTDRNTLERID
jgi:hypothetical protein